jgi:hypothetical protein
MEYCQKMTAFEIRLRTLNAIFIHRDRGQTFVQNGFMFAMVILTPQIGAINKTR